MADLWVLSPDDQILCWEPYSCHGVGLPEGYVELANATPEQLQAALPSLLRRTYDLERRVTELERS